MPTQVRVQLLLLLWFICILCRQEAVVARITSQFIDLFLSASLYHFMLVKEALIEIGCVVTSLVGWSLVGCLVVTRVHCGQTLHPRPIVTMEH